MDKYMSMKGKDDLGPELFILPPPPKPPEEKENEKMEEGNISGVMEIKDRCMACKNFNARTSKLGIVKEGRHPQILEQKEGKIQLDELIDLALVTIIDNAREVGMNLLNNAKNSRADDFWSIKWLFYELDQVKER